ncbi:DUF2891 domain-containing protein [Kordiimonas sp.]|uniref:DUF2891 domain-containing protein n=1 Tax=Kordiimonas sp. TaxID=1970157 RepID=UPI003B529CF7
MKRTAILGIAAAACLATAACEEKPATDGHGTEAISLPDARDGVVTDRFARMALSCIHREYPNKISHVMNSDKDAKPPKALTPAFYGCFDWHSSVHGHWLLVRLSKLDPASPFTAITEQALEQSFSIENLNREVAYYTAKGRNGFERPYGIAWYLQLVAELHESPNAVHKSWREILAPLEAEIVKKMSAWLPNLAYPVRLGTHNQSAFAFGLMLDYARTVGNAEFEALLTERTRTFFADDTNCPIGYEPSGEDFLSPCLMEADLMRRVMDVEEFSAWLTAFLPGIPDDGSASWLTPAIVKDATDGKLVHLDGVNLSRAWALEGIASALSDGDPRIPSLLAAADVHKKAGIEAVSDAHYAGSHWLASFATYLTTKRGISDMPEKP